MKKSVSKILQEAYKEKDWQKVLSPFGQAEGPFARRFKGVGLGLPLVKNLAEMHDGTLELDSKPGNAKPSQAYNRL